MPNSTDPKSDSYIRLGINIDHVATVRNARGGPHPDPVRAALLAEKAGADGITAHLREDRRHISDRDIERLMRDISLPLNFEMAATEEMLEIALREKPHAACIVPEKREERTTEGGLDAHGGHNYLTPTISKLNDAGIRVSLFVEADEIQLDAAVRLKAPVVEIHAGAYCDAWLEGNMERFEAEFERIRLATEMAVDRGLEVHVGHGITYDTVQPISALSGVTELNIGHFLMGEAMFVGLEESIKQMRQLMVQARQNQSAEELQ